MKGGIQMKQKDQYVGTRRAWDKRYLITVSTHILRKDKIALEEYCHRNHTTPYNLLKSYLNDLVTLAKIEQAQEYIELCRRGETSSSFIPD